MTNDLKYFASVGLGVVCTFILPSYFKTIYSDVFVESHPYSFTFDSFLMVIAVMVASVLLFDGFKKHRAIIIGLISFLLLMLFFTFIDSIKSETLTISDVWICLLGSILIGFFITMLVIVETPKPANSTLNESKTSTISIESIENAHLIKKLKEDLHKANGVYHDIDENYRHLADEKMQELHSLIENKFEELRFKDSQSKINEIEKLILKNKNN